MVGPTRWVGRDRNGFELTPNAQRRTPKQEGSMSEVGLVRRPSRDRRLGGERGLATETQIPRGKAGLARKDAKTRRSEEEFTEGSLSDSERIR